MHGLVVENARALLDGEIISCSIGIDEGKISRIGKILKGEETFDARGMLVMPGAIDTHVHFRDLRQEEKEDWLTGSRAAIYGGVTTVVDMPNTDPPTVDEDSFEVKRTVAQNRCMIDFAINGGVSGNLKRLPRLWELGVLAFGEVFMAHSTGGMGLDPETLREALKMIARLGAMASIHAEDEALHERLKKTLKNDTSASVYSQMRPPESEVNAVTEAIELQRLTKVPMHITHVSTAKSIELISKAGITCDVTPHHLFLTMGHWKRLGARAKMNPPIRDDRDVNALWKAVNEGTVEVLASDHAPHTADEKKLPVREAPAGVPGVETMMPLMLKAVADGRLPLQRLIDMTSANPAMVFGIGGKGRLARGYDADLIFVDMGAKSVITAANLHSKAGWTPYEGFEGIFPSAVMLRGELLLDGKEFYAKRGAGRLIRGKGYARRPKSAR
ncbi:MAG: dihydroorotase [Methanocella sp. PtaU1.Bin125]|nr:MAG: dihydroorotase [Methanocella sp. PtaU1.Bin125]